MSQPPSGSLRRTRRISIDGGWRSSKTWRQSLNVSVGDVRRGSTRQGFSIRTFDASWVGFWSRGSADWATTSISKWVRWEFRLTTNISNPFTLHTITCRNYTHFTCDCTHVLCLLAFERCSQMFMLWRAYFPFSIEFRSAFSLPRSLMWLISWKRITIKRKFVRFAATRPTRIDTETSRRLFMPIAI